MCNFGAILNWAAVYIDLITPLAETDENDKDLLQKINTIIPSLNGLDPDQLAPMTFGPHKMAKNKYYGPKVMAKPRYLILLYVAGRLEHFKSDFGLQIDNNIYFSARSLEKIANYKGFKQRIEYDRTRAVKDHYLLFEGLVIHRREEVPKQKDPSKTTFTDLVALTKKGQEYCETKVETLLTTIPEERRPKQKLTEDVVSASNAREIDEGLRKDLYKEHGLDWLAPDYFECHKSTEDDLVNWRKGFSFDLPSIKARRELRRETLIADIKGKLENEGKLLIVGQSGSSKSTILMELICDYFDDGYEVLYNHHGVTDLRNADGLVNFIEDRLRNIEKILVAIDDAHNERTYSIFYVIDKLLNSQLTKNLRFIITARVPEFDSLLEGLDKVQEEIRKSIRKLVGDPKFRYSLPYFSKEEIKDFRRLYVGIIDDDVTEKNSQEIYDYTKGDPIMVKFSVSSCRQDGSCTKKPGRI
jgi:hypothetical protein